MNYYSNELKSEISECYVNGASIDDLERQFKLDRPILRYILKKTGVYKKTKSLHIWTEEEMDLLKTYYSIYDFNTIDKLFPNHSHSSIVHKCYELHLTRDEYRKKLKKEFSPEIYAQDIIYPEKKPLDFTSSSITYPTVTSKMKPRDDWYTKSEMDYIVSHYQEMNDEEIGKAINRTPKSVQYKRLQLGLKRSSHYSYPTLREFIRINNSKWKKDSMRSCNYKCVITGQRFDEIHHIVSFAFLLDSSLHELGYGFNYDTRCYTSSELKAILNKFKEIQGRYPLGVCLTKDKHEKFHLAYGYGNNTPEQWDEFYYNETQKS